MVVGIVAGSFALPLAFTTMCVDVFALPKTIGMLGLGVLLSLALTVLLWRGGRIARTGSLLPTVALTAYIALVMAATLRSPDPIHSLIGERFQYQGALAALGYGLAFVAASLTLTTEARARRLMVAVGLSSALVVAYGLMQAMDLDPIWDELNKGRIFSTLGQANALAAWLVLALPLVLALAIASDGPGRLGFGALAVAIVFTIGLTMSRGGYLGAAAGSTAFVVLVARRSDITGRRAAIAGVVVAAVALISMSSPASTTTSRIASRIGSIADVTRGSAASHFDLWSIGIAMTLDNPLLGVGPEMYPIELPRYRNDVLPPDRAANLARFRPESPHSVPIAIAAGTGIPALAAYLALVIAVVVGGCRGWATAARGGRVLAAGFLAAAVGHVVTDLFMTAEVSTSWMFWVVLGAITAIPFRPGQTPPAIRD